MGGSLGSQAPNPMSPNPMSLNPMSLNPMSLNPMIRDKLSRILRPDFARTVRTRRITAGALVLLAGVAAWHPDPDSTSHDAVVAVRDLGPGITLSAADVAVRKRPAGTLPEGSVATLNTVVGAILASPVRRGEVLTDVRVLGSRLTELSVGPDARTVPLHLAHAAVLDVIRPGDVVDVLGAPSTDSDARPRLLARDAVVVLVSPAGADRVVLVALPAAPAVTLAGASLTQSVTVTIH